MIVTRQKGSILIVVLILMTMAVSLSLYITSVSREIVRSSGMIMDKLQAKLDAGSMAEKLIYTMSTSRFGSWSVENSGAIRGLPAGLNLRGNPIRCGNSEIRLLDGASRFGLWPPPPALVGNLLAEGGGKASIVASVRDGLADWIDQDDLKRLSGAERFYYQFEKGSRFLPRNGRFIQSAEELMLIRGVDSEAFAKIRDAVGDSNSTTINVNTASAPVLSAVLGISRESAQRIVQLRERKGGISYSDVAAISGKGLTFVDEYTTTFTSLTVLMEIDTKVGEARERIHSVINFKPSKQNPYTIEKFCN